MIPFKQIYDMQIENQSLLVNNNLYDNVDKMPLPVDNVSLASYHIQQLMSEIGEVLEADKRWKNIRNDKYDRAHKLEEIADCFIVLMNIAIENGNDITDVEPCPICQKMMRNAGITKLVTILSCNNI